MPIIMGVGVVTWHSSALGSSASIFDQLGNSSF